MGLLSLTDLAIIFRYLYPKQQQKSIFILCIFLLYSKFSNVVTDARELSLKYSFLQERLIKKILKTKPSHILG